jgi:acetyl esterase/lipase
MLEKLPSDRPLDLTEIPAARVKMKKMVTAMLANLPAVEGVSSQDRFAPGPQGSPDVRVRVYRPNDQPSKLPAMLWIHGGGYVMGDIEPDDRLMKQIAKRIGCVAVSVDYRLAPEHPFPAPVEDCYAALKWLFASVGELGVDPSRIAIGGASGGGGLAAGLALLTRDRGEVKVAFAMSRLQVMRLLIRGCGIARATVSAGKPTWAATVEAPTCPHMRPRLVRQI